MNTQAIARQEVEQYILDNFEEGANGGKRTIEKEIGDEYLEINFEYDGHYRLISGNYDHPDYCEYEVEYKGKAYTYDEDGNLTSETPLTDLCLNKIIPL